MFESITWGQSILFIFDFFNLCLIFRLMTYLKSEVMALREQNKLLKQNLEAKSNDSPARS